MKSVNDLFQEVADAQTVAGRTPPSMCTAHFCKVSKRCVVQEAVLRLGTLVLWNIW